MIPNKRPITKSHLHFLSAENRTSIVWQTGKRAGHLHRHTDCDRPDGDVFRPVDLVPSIPDSLDQQIDPQDKDEGSHHGNR